MTSHVRRLGRFAGPRQTDFSSGRGYKIPTGAAMPRLSRRDWFRLARAWGALAALRPWNTAAQTVRRTPTQVLGPFYPVTKPADQDADLTVIAGRSGRAAGQAIELSGRVVNRQGKPVSGARIEIWQANTHGRYTHPS